VAAAAAVLVHKNSLFECKKGGNRAGFINFIFFLKSDLHIKNIMKTNFHRQMLSKTKNAIFFLPLTLQMDYIDTKLESVV